MTNIMQYFPKKLTPRPVQVAALKEIEKRWNSADILVVNLPVAAGKSAISLTIAHWQKRCSIITPTKLLVDQYKNEYNYIHVLKAKSDYWCDTFKCPVSKRPGTKKTGMLCKKDLGCSGCQVYLKDLRKARVMPYLLSNYYIYLSHSLYRPTLIVDEAHNLIDTLKDLASKKLWQFNYKFPDHLNTRESIKQWVNSLPNSAFTYKYKQDGERVYSKQAGLEFLKQELNSYRPTYLVSIEKDTYRGEEFKCIKLTPLDISSHPPIMWPSAVKKIVLLSATISSKDIEQLGLSGRKIQYLQADSPIDSERRPVLVPKTGVSMAARVQDQNLPELAKFIQELAGNYPTEKGVIHATYSLARKLYQYKAWDPEIFKRFIFHSKENKSKKYQEFRDSEEPKIIIASGMYEGIDLPYNAGRWQVLSKLPWPSLADPAIRYLCEVDEEWYAWETIKDTLQACGRICRTPEDRGSTYIFDSTFKSLYKRYNQLFPDWFKCSVNFET